MQTSKHSCRVCASSRLMPVPAFELLPRVTSDCKPWPNGGQIFMCQTCGCIQKQTDPKWQSDVAKIYADYTPYASGNGVEQSVFQTGPGSALPRSAKILRHLRQAFPLLPKGRLLDVGCGNGCLLSEFHQRFPAWDLFGVEKNNRHQSKVEAMPGVRKVYTEDDPRQIPGKFDLITLHHVLEHLPHPRHFLSVLRTKLAPAGKLVIQVPDFLKNPFDALIADHCTHFCSTTAENLLVTAGFQILLNSREWIDKEITLIVCPNSADSSPCPPQSSKTVPPAFLKTHIKWLLDLNHQASIASQQKNFGIFGTSIAGSWLFGALDGRVAFFVDEDPNRMDHPYLERPVMSPPAVPSNAHVLIALPYFQAAPIKKRMQKKGYGGTWHVPQPNLFTTENEMTQ